jgi:hypothetical protein
MHWIGKEWLSGGTCTGECPWPGRQNVPTLANGTFRSCFAACQRDELCERGWMQITCDYRTGDAWCSLHPAAEVKFLVKGISICTWPCG